MSPHSSPRPVRQAAAVLAAAAAVGLTACQHGTTRGSGSSSASASHGTGADTASGGGDTAGSSQQTGRPTSSGRPPRAAGSTRCAATSMRMRLGGVDAGAGNLRYALVFTNSGRQPCILRGYPGVSLMARDAQSIGKPATREGVAGGPVTLAPGASAHAELHTLNEGLGGAGCWKSADLVLAYPPGSKESMTTRTSGLRICGEEFSVSAVTPGIAG
ncbi:DUF4232 domain-containing protein [Streptomyces sp. NPDC056411]|uniref:DUF4232 domain-containing protein n=1 Tax=Streptomyces sp. NPDC056411 TaxID=3345813 RepID=UPI0035E1EAD0